MLDIRKRTGWMFFAAMVTQIILVSAQVPSKSGVPVLSKVTFELFSRVERAAFSVFHGSRGVWDGYVALRGVRTENETLKRRIADLQVQVQEESAQASRAGKLQALMNLRTSVQVPTLAAEVIGANPNPDMRTITIDRGSADGVLPDMAVISPAGVVGRVIGPTARHASRVQLLIDRNAAAGALTERTRAGGMVTGVESLLSLQMELVSNLADVKPGDAILASGIDGIFPKGFLIGWVETSDRGAGLYRTITVRPAVDFSGIEEVLVVLVPPRPIAPAEAAK